MKYKNRLLFVVYLKKEKKTKKVIKTLKFKTESTSFDTESTSFDTEPAEITGPFFFFHSEIGRSF